jgi:TRAP-type mannitol/chloroaromatic compound transport system substrate-binding protein
MGDSMASSEIKTGDNALPSGGQARPDSTESVPSRDSLESRIIDRRLFIGAAAGMVAGGVASACAAPGAGGGPNVIAQPSVQWRLASSYPRALDALFGSAEILAEKLSAITDGKFQIRPYAAGDVVPALEVLDAVQSGSVQVGHTPSYYYTGKNPALAFDTTVPFGMTARQHNAWFIDGGGLELMRGLFADFGIINFLGGNTGTQMGGWFKREVNSLADLRGLKMRIPGLGGEVMNRLNVTVQVLGGPDIYPALERGAIDATEWVGPYDDERLGFQRAAKFYYSPGWWEPSAASSFMVNRAAWDQLPSSYQAAFQSAVSEASQRTQTIYDARNPEALARLVSGGTQLRIFSEDIMVAASAAARDILEQNASANPATYGRIYEAWKKFRNDSFRWFMNAEQEYARFAFAKSVM